MKRGTRVRGRRGRHVHLTLDLRIALCGLRCDGFLLVPDESLTCERCYEASEFN